MPDYLVTLTAHIDAQRRPENFPTVIKDTNFVTVNSMEELLKFVNNRVVFYAQTRGFSGVLDSTKVEDLRIVDTNRVWVPMDMITHITPFYKQITGKMPLVSQSGITEFASGKDVVKN